MMDKETYEVMINFSKKVNMLDKDYEKQKSDNAMLKVLLQKKNEEKHHLQLQLQATIEALEELKHDDKSLQVENDALKTLL